MLNNMSSWQERADQERLRLAREQAAVQRAAQRTADQARNDQETLTIEHLGLFRQLGIWRILAEIQRDLWKGNSTIQPPSDSDLKRWVSAVCI